MMREGNWLDLFQEGGINCRGGLFLFKVYLIFINSLKEYWTVDKLETLDKSVEKDRLQSGSLGIV